MMKEDAKLKLYIPHKLGNGDSGTGGPIPGGAVFIFSFKVLTVSVGMIIIIS